MYTVGIRELKNHLSEYIARVKTGEEILVTERDQVVAELKKPTAKKSKSSDIESLLDKLEGIGLLASRAKPSKFRIENLPRPNPRKKRDDSWWQDYQDGKDNFNHIR